MNVDQAIRFLKDLKNPPDTVIKSISIETEGDRGIHKSKEWKHNPPTIQSKVNRPLKYKNTEDEEGEGGGCDVRLWNNGKPKRCGKKKMEGGDSCKRCKHDCDKFGCHRYNRVGEPRPTHWGHTGNPYLVFL